MSDPGDNQDDLTAVAAAFWKSMGNGDVHRGQELARSCQVPVLRPFASLEEEEEDGLAGTFNAAKLSFATSKTVVSAWNHEGEVGLMKVEKDGSCLALVGRPTGGQDNRMCHLSNCVSTLHEDMARFDLPEDEEGCLVVAIRNSSQSQNLAFTRPLLEISTLPEDFVDGYGVEWLLSIKAKPRVWRYLIGFLINGFEWEDNEEDNENEIELEQQLDQLGRQAFAFENESVDEGGVEDEDVGSGGGELKEEESLDADSTSDYQALRRRLDDMQSLINRQGDELELYKQRDTAREKALAKTFSTVRRRMREAKAEIEVLKGLVGQAGSSSTRPGIVSDSHLRSLIQREFNTQGVAFATDIPNDLVPLMSSLRNAVKPDGLLDKLSDRVGLLESRTTDAVVVGDKVFRNISDCAAWLQTFTDRAIGTLCVDAKTLFVLLEESYDSVQSGLTAEASSVKAGYATFSAAAASISYRVVYPGVLLRHSGKDEHARDEGICWVSSCASHKTFKGEAMSSTLKSLLKRLEAIKKTLLNSINMMVPSTTSQQSQTRAILTQMANDAYEHATGLLNSIDPLYTTIHQGGMGEKEAWRRVMLFVKGVFDSIQLVRNVTLDSSPAGMIWGSMLTNQLCAGYHLHGWTKHPDVSNILALSAMEHEGDAINELKTIQGELKGKLKTLESEQTKSAKQIKKLEEKVL
jgi:hypothetical protein